METDSLEIAKLKENAGAETSAFKFNKKLLSGLFDKKYIKVVVLIVVLVVVLLVYFASGNKSNNVEKTKVKTSSYQTTLEYCAALEEKLQSVLSCINGIGNVEVMISVDGSPKLNFASDTDTKTSTTTNGTTTTTSSSPIILNGNNSSNALILTEELPNVKGVIVVASGAGRVDIKLDILNAVSTLLDISTEKISILKGN